MKKIITIIGALTFCFNSYAQTYPYSNNFDSYADSTLPAGMVNYSNYNSGNTLILQNNAGSEVGKYCVDVLPNTGTLNSKAMVFKTYSTLWNIDSLVYSPTIGTLNANSILEFDYSYILHPTATSTLGIFPNSFSKIDNNGVVHPYNFTPTFKIYAIDLSNNAITLIHQIDSTNHTPTISYLHKQISLSNLAGKNIKLVFRFHKGYTMTYFDEMMNQFRLDNLQIQDGVSTDIKNETKLNNISIYPNPIQNELLIDFSSETINTAVNYELVDAIGKIVLSGNLLTQKNIVNTTNLSTGFYMLNIKNERGTLLSSNKLIK